MSAQRCHCWPEGGKVIENAPPPETKERYERSLGPSEIQN